MKSPVLNSMNMLKAILMIVLTTFSVQVWAVDCSSTDIALSSQNDYDNFQTTYGGGGICDRVAGNLWVNGGGSVTNIDGLADLASVGGNLNIDPYTTLTDLDGLANLVSVGGHLIFGNNTSLTNIDGLPALTSVGGVLGFDTNLGLVNIDGLNNLVSIGQELRIYKNNALININGLVNLTTVGNLKIDQNDLLASFSAWLISRKY